MSINLILSIHILNIRFQQQTIEGAGIVLPIHCMNSPITCQQWSSIIKNFACSGPKEASAEL